MKKRISLHSLLQNDKLMMIVSLVLAIVIWSLVVYGPSNSVEMDITGVPVSITLNDYASQTLNLRIVDGANATATVTVRGLRSVVSKLKPQDLTVVADTGNVIKEGTYVLSLRPGAVEDCSVVKVVGADGTSATVTITCDVWREVSYPVEVEMPSVTVADTEKYQFGTPAVSGEAVTEGQVMLAGPKSEISRVQKVVAVIEDRRVISETEVFDATLQARDEQGNVLESVSFRSAEDGKVSVTVPVMVYRKVSLTPSALHVPSGYANTKNLVTVSPKEIELWGVPSEIDDYIESIQKQIEVDFDQLTPDALTRTVTLQTVDGIRPVNGNETITVKVALSGLSKRTLEVPLSASNFSVINCPAGYTVTTTQTKLPTVTLYGPSRALSRVKVSDVRVVVDMANTATSGQQTVRARLSIANQDTVWAYYGKDSTGIEVLVSVAQS